MAVCSIYVSPRVQKMQRPEKNGKHSNKGGPKPRLVREACVQDTRVDKECLLPIGLWTLAHPPDIYTSLLVVCKGTYTRTHDGTHECSYGFRADTYLMAYANTRARTLNSVTPPSAPLAGSALRSYQDHIPSYSAANSKEAIFFFFAFSARVVT